MSSKGNTNHLRLMKKLKMVKKYKNDNLNIRVETWSFKAGNSETKVKLWSGSVLEYIFKGSTISELERFINEEREKAGLFKPRGTRHKVSLLESVTSDDNPGLGWEVLNESKSG